MNDHHSPDPAHGDHYGGHPHDHAHGTLDPVLLTSQRGIWALKWSLWGLLATAFFQLAIVLISNSVALLADTIHNFGDAAVVIPLWIAFIFVRKKPTSRFTFGVQRALASYGLAYQQGGRIVGASAGAPSRSVETMIRARDLSGLEIEFNRAVQTVRTDPPAAITAACSILESLCRIYIEAHALQAPCDQSLGPLWNRVRQHLGLGLSGVVADDMRKILGGLSTVTDGIGALRTHAGSAHG